MWDCLNIKSTDKNNILHKGYRNVSKNKCVNNTIGQEVDQCYETFSNRFKYINTNIDIEGNVEYKEEQFGIDSLDLYNHYCGIELTFNSNINLDMEYQGTERAIE